jgi:putative hydrolase
VARRDADAARARAVEAIDRAVYFMDRALAPAQKVRAFRNARAIVEEMDATELCERVEAGTLTDLDGIGPSTGGVIADAVEDRPSAYVDKLERGSRIEISDEGSAIRAALKGDCHSHTTWSDGGAPTEVMARAAMALGHEYLVVTDHSPRLTIAHGLSPERLAQQRAEIDRLNEELSPFRILRGVEVDILEDGGLDLPEAELERLDVVVASVHSKLRMPEHEMTRRMVLAAASPHVDILGHCTGRQIVGRGRPPSRFDPDLVFAACAQFDTAVEINCRPERQDPPDELLELALGWGCRISIDTDAHAPGQLEWQPSGCDKAARHGIEPDQIVNTMSADDLVSWAASHPS